MRPGPKPHSLYLYDVFLLVSKERGLHKLLVSIHEVIKLQNFESGVSDVIPVNVENISSQFSLHIFIDFMEEKSFCKLLRYF